MSTAPARPRALVTGASRGIGKAIAVGLAAVGYDVAIAARTVRPGDPVADYSVSVHQRASGVLPGSLAETAAAVAAHGAEAVQLRIDLTDSTSVTAGLAELLHRWDGVDVVVNNGRHVGPGIADTILDTPAAQFELFLAAHAVAPALIAQAVLPTMLARGRGAFITITSVAGTGFYPTRRPGAGGSGLAYRMAKAAGHSLVGSIISEYGAAGITGYNVNPGSVLTERNANQLAGIGFDPARAAPPELIAAVVVRLLRGDDAVRELVGQDVDAQRLAREWDLYSW